MQNLNDDVGLLGFKNGVNSLFALSDQAFLNHQNINRNNNSNNEIQKCLHSRDYTRGNIHQILFRLREQILYPALYVIGGFRQKIPDGICHLKISEPAILDPVNKMLHISRQCHHEAGNTGNHGRNNQSHQKHQNHDQKYNSASDAKGS